MSISELCDKFLIDAKADLDRNIIEFAEAPWGLGMGSVRGVPSLFPGQKFILKCYYNIPLDNTEKRLVVTDKFNEKELFRFTEEEYLHYLHEEGRINVKEVTGDPKNARQNLILAVGRRGSKTSTIGILTAYEAYKLLRKECPQEYFGILQEEIRISCVATNQDQALLLFRNISGNIERSEYFKKFRNKPTNNHMLLNSQRDMDMYGTGIGQRPSIRIVAAPCSGKGLRGPSNIIIILDEIAFFFEHDVSIDRSADAVYDAITPSVSGFKNPDGTPAGRIICISSPANRSGKFFELYENSLKPECDNWLMVRAPTWEINPTVSSKNLRSAYMENPITYMNEYGAEFSDSYSAWIEDERILRMNIVPGLKEKKMSYERVPHFMGLDLALKNDGCAIAVSHVVKQEQEGVLRNFIELDYCDVRYPEEEGKDSFRIEEILDWIVEVCGKFYIVKGAMDQWAGPIAVPMLHDRGINYIESIAMSRDLNSKIYQNLMSRMIDGTLRIPEEDSLTRASAKKIDTVLVSELLKLQATQHSKYLVSVAAPEGAHDDLSDAFARSVYLACNFLASTGGIVKSNLITNTTGGLGFSYKQYLRKEKKSLYYTKRPSSTIQSQMSQRNMGLGSGRY